MDKLEKHSNNIKFSPLNLDLLDESKNNEFDEVNRQYAIQIQKKINETFKDLGIEAKCVSFKVGPSITRYNLEFNGKFTFKTIKKAIDDISSLLDCGNIRFQEVIENEKYSGLEISNIKPGKVYFKDVVKELGDVKKYPTEIGFGKDVNEKVIKADFTDLPHLLVAGTSGSGKSIFIHSIITSLIMRLSPTQLKFVLVDPKQVEMAKYKEMPHLLTPIITDAKKATVCLNKLVDEMNDRYSKFLDADGCINIKEYNEYAKKNKIEEMPYIIVVLDEYADLYDTNKDVSRPVANLAQKARAAGIHLLVATQRPSTNIINGVIKANLTTRVALMTASSTDSITTIGGLGAESLMGKGDMLVNSPSISRISYSRLQGCYISNGEIKRVVNYLKDNYETKYEEKFTNLDYKSKDSLLNKPNSNRGNIKNNEEEEMAYQSTKDWVMTLDYVSISKIQRECGFGFNRSGRFFSRLQKEGIISLEKDQTGKGCKVLIK